MAITVGELLVAIQADDAPLRKALAEVDRLSKGYADRSVSYQKAVDEARKGSVAAQKALNAEQKKLNAALKVMEDRLESGGNITREMERNYARVEKSVQKASAKAQEAREALTTAISARDNNKLEMARAREAVKAARYTENAEKEIADRKKKENKLTENEYAGKKKMQAAANRDINKQRKAALKEEEDVEKRIAAERERYRKLDLNQRQSAINNHIAELQRREQHEIESEKRIAGEKARQRKREVAARKRAMEDALNERYGPVGQQMRQGQALPPGMRLRNGQLVPISTGRQPMQGPALPPGMRMSGGRMVPIVTPPRPPRAPRAARGFTAPGMDTFGITSTLVATAGLAELTRTANEMQVVQQRLAQVSASGEEAAIAFNKLAAGSQRLRQPLSETVELYTKLRQSNQNVGMSANETIKVTEAFSAALRISGATGQTAASSLLQFGQAMAKGKLDGDEFRTVAENASEVLRVLERQTGYSRGELLKMREEGKLTAKMMADALIKEYDNLIDRATKLAPSLSQGATALKNSLLIAMTNTRDARTAVEELAKKMVALSEVIQENGPLLYAIGKFALGLFLAKKAVDGVKFALQALAAIPVPTPLKLIALMFGGAALAQDYAKSKAVGELEGAIEKTEKLSDAYKMVEKHTARATEATKLYNEMKAKYGDSKDPRSQAVVTAAKARMTEEMRLLDKASKHMKAIRDMSNKPMITTADAPTEGKKGGSAKDTVDQEIRALVERYKMGTATEAQLQRLNDLRQQQLKIYQDTNDVIKQQNAYENLKLIEDAARAVNGEVSMLGKNAGRVQQFAENFDLMFSEMTTEDVQDVLKYMRYLEEQVLPNLDKGSEEYLQTLKRIKDIQEALAKSDPFAATRLPEGEKDPNKKLTMLERHVRNLQRALLDMALSAPGELFTTYFDAMVESVETGTSRVREAMQSKIGNIMKDVGKNLIEQGMSKLAGSFQKSIKKAFGKIFLSFAGPTTALGKFITAIKKKLANPLIAGPALIALGVAMAAYGAKMGAAGRSAGEELGGGIGSLGIGGQEKTLRYTFADRRNPLEGNRVIGAPMQPIMVQQTIIGPNDPVAQRQIGEMVNNAARRGIVKRNG